uniref:Uncharacterized protein n=1 Tax=Acrobeloides nanus TaxID=290746 RepID=A0A914DP81_9BILA
MLNIVLPPKFQETIHYISIVVMINFAHHRVAIKMNSSTQIRERLQFLKLVVVTQIHATTTVLHAILSW